MRLLLIVITLFFVIGVELGVSASNRRMIGRVASEMIEVKDRVKTISEEVLREEAEVLLGDLEDTYLKYISVLQTIEQHTPEEIESQKKMWETKIKCLENKLEATQNENSQLRRELEGKLIPDRSTIARIFMTNVLEIREISRVRSINRKQELIDQIKSGYEKIVLFEEILDHPGGDAKRIATLGDMEDVRAFLRQVTPVFPSATAAERNMVWRAIKMKEEARLSKELIIKVKQTRIYEDAVARAVVPVDSYNRLVDQFNNYVEVMRGM